MYIVFLAKHRIALPLYASLEKCHEYFMCGPSLDSKKCLKLCKTDITCTLYVYISLFLTDILLYLPHGSRKAVGKYLGIAEAQVNGPRLRARKNPDQ